MDLTFKEKSLLSQLIALFIAFFGYFYTVLPQSSTHHSTSLIPQLIVLVIALVLINIIGHIAASVTSIPESEDERDKLILLKASKAKSILLSSGIILSVLLSLKLENGFWAVQILLGILVIAEIAEKLIQLFYYRKGL